MTLPGSPLRHLIALIGVGAAGLALAACQVTDPSSPAPPPATVSPSPAPPAATPAPIPSPSVAAMPPLPPIPSSCPVTPPVPPTAADPPPEDFPAPAWHRNAERTIWAGLAPAYRENQWFAGRALKVRWWRRGTLMIVGRRLDGPAPPLAVSLDGRAQGTPTPGPAAGPTPPPWSGGPVSSGIHLPVAGCWEITARTEWDELRLVVYAYPPALLEGWPGMG